jgi:hypothetical protein
LRGTLTADSEEKRTQNTLTSKKFPGGSLKIVAARAHAATKKLGTVIKERKIAVPKSETTKKS